MGADMGLGPSDVASKAPVNSSTRSRSDCAVSSPPPKRPSASVNRRPPGTSPCLPENSSTTAGVSRATAASAMNASARAALSGDTCASSNCTPSRKRRSAVQCRTRSSSASPCIPAVAAASSECAAAAESSSGTGSSSTSIRSGRRARASASNGVVVSRRASTVASAGCAASSRQNCTPDGMAEIIWSSRSRPSRPPLPLPTACTSPAITCSNARRLSGARSDRGRPLRQPSSSPPSSAASFTFAFAAQRTIASRGCGMRGPRLSSSPVSSNRSYSDATPRVSGCKRASIAFQPSSPQRPATAARSAASLGMLCVCLSSSICRRCSSVR